MAVGFAAVDLLDGEPYLEQLSVRASYMRRGIGSALIHSALDIARHGSAATIWLTTYAHLPWNRPFYEMHGFSVMPERRCGAEILRELEQQRRWLPHPQERIVMCKPLNGGAPPRWRRAMTFTPAMLRAHAHRDACEAPESSPVARVRIARATTQLESVVAFYHDGLGFPVVERFAAHAGYDGVVLALPGAAHLEFTRRAQDVSRPTPGADDLLVVYLPSARQVARLRRRMERRGHALCPAGESVLARQERDIRGSRSLACRAL